MRNFWKMKKEMENKTTVLLPNLSFVNKGLGGDFSKMYLKILYYVNF